MVKTLTTDRTDFNETWLAEMPSGVGNIETFDAISYSIKDLLSHGVVPDVLANGVNRVKLSSTIYYWYEKDSVILLGSQLSIRPQGLVVQLTGKNPRLRGQPPYASQLYNEILKDSGKGIRILSDTSLSDEGLNLWKKLVSLGHTVSVYDSENPGKTFQTFSTPHELDAFFKDDDTDFSRYQYVVSESGINLAETRSYFNTRRYRELAGLNLQD